MCFTDCYAAAGAGMTAHPQWTLHGDDGKPITLHGNADMPFYDLTQPTVRAHVANWSVDVSGCFDSSSSSCISGVFADKGGDYPFRQLSAARNAAFRAAHHASLSLLARKTRVFANAFSVGNRLKPNGTEVLPFVDGVCFEHFLSFEMLDAATGFLNPALFTDAVSLINTATAAGKVVLVRGWPGPVSTPITPLGPSYSKMSGLTTPRTYAERQATAAKWVESVLCAYLIVSSPTTYLSYNWWYDIADGVVPCANTPNSCASPPDWFPILTKSVGEPSGPPTRRENVWQRDFKHARVIFDAADMLKSRVVWF